MPAHYAINVCITYCKSPLCVCLPPTKWLHSPFYVCLQLPMSAHLFLYIFAPNICISPQCLQYHIFSVGTLPMLHNPSMCLHLLHTHSLFVPSSNNCISPVSVCSTITTQCLHIPSHYTYTPNWLHTSSAYQFLHMSFYLYAINACLAHHLLHRSLCLFAPPLSVSVCTTTTRMPADLLSLFAVPQCLCTLPMLA